LPWMEAPLRLVRKRGQHLPTTCKRENEGEGNLGPLWEGFSRGFISSFTWSPPKRLFCGRLRSWSPSNHALWSCFAREEPQNTSFARLHAAPASIWQPCPLGPSGQACGIGGGISRRRPPEVAHAAAVGPSSRTSRRHSLEARHRWRRGSRRQENLLARVSEDPDEEEAREERGGEGRRLSASVRRWRGVGAGSARAPPLEAAAGQRSSRTRVTAWGRRGPESSSYLFVGPTTTNFLFF
jgi:hypothetical protein